MVDALMVVDVQEGFVSSATESTAEKIENLLAESIFDPVIFTKFRNIDGSPHKNFLNWHKMTTDPECAIWSGIKKEATIVIEKSLYTGVTEELKAVILEKNINRLYLTGFDTDCCVLITAADLFQMGVKPVVLSDYCGSGGGEQSHEAGLKVLSRLIGRQNIISDIHDIDELRRIVSEQNDN